MHDTGGGFRIVKVYLRVGRKSVDLLYTSKPNCQK
jgi:hypothetical protein